MVLNVHRNHKACQGRGEGGGRGYGGGGGGRGRLYTYRYNCHHQNDSCIKMGSDESHLNVSVESDGQSRKTMSRNHNLFEEKGEPKRYQTEVLPLTSLKPVLNWANVCVAEHTSDTSTIYDSFLN